MICRLGLTIDLGTFLNLATSLILATPVPKSSNAQISAECSYIFRFDKISASFKGIRNPMAYGRLKIAQDNTKTRFEVSRHTHVNKGNVGRVFTSHPFNRDLWPIYCLGGKTVKWIPCRIYSRTYLNRFERLSMANFHANRRKRGTLLSVPKSSNDH